MSALSTCRALVAPVDGHAERVYGTVTASEMDAYFERQERALEAEAAPVEDPTIKVAVDPSIAAM